MADHEGWYLKANVDISGLLQANRESNKLLVNLRKVDAGFGKIHGNDKLAGTIKSADIATSSYIERLKSEGKQYQADQEKVKLYQEQVQRLTAKQHELTGALSEIASKSGKASDAYNVQKARINETATAINDFKKDISSTQSEMNKLHPSVFDRIKNKVTGANNEGKKSHSIFKSVFSGVVAGGAVQNALSSIGSGFKNSIKEGLQLNAGAARINATFKHMGLSSNRIKILTDQMGYLKTNVGLTGDQISGMQRQMLTWSRIGKAGATEMTTAIAAIGAGSGMSTDKIAQMGSQLMRVGSTGKVTASSLNRITRNSSTLYAMLAKGAGTSQHHMKAMLATGKVTQTQFQTWLAKSSKYAGTVFKQYGRTQTGALNRIHGAWQEIEKNMTAPLFNVKTKGMQDLASLMTSSAVKQGATLLGQALRSVANYAERGLSFVVKHKTDIVGIGSDAVKIAGVLAKSVWKDFTGIVVDIGKSLGLVNRNAKGNGLHSFKLAMDGLAKNKTAIQAIAHSLVVIAGLRGLLGVTRGVNGIMQAFDSKTTVGKLAVGSYRNGVIGGLMGKIPRRGDYNWETHEFEHTGRGGAGIFSGALESMHHAAGTEGGIKGMSMAGKLANGAAGVGVAVDAGSQFVKAFQDRHNANKRSQDIGKGIGAGIGGGIGLYFGGPLGAAIGAKIGGVVGKWGGQAVNKFTRGWQSHKPPKNFWSLENLGWSTHDMFRKMGTGWNQFWGKAGNGVKSWQRKTSSGIGHWASGVSRGWNHGVKGVQTWFKKIPSNIGRTGSKIKSWASGVGRNIHKGWNKGITASHNFFKNLPKNTSKAAHGIARGFGRAWTNTKRGVRSFGRWYMKNWQNIFKAVNNNRYVRAFKKGQLFQVAFRDMRSRWNAFSKWFGKGWHSFWSGVGRWARSSWRGTVRNWNNFWGTLPKKWNAFKSSFGKAWHSFWGGIGSFFKGIWDKIKSIYDHTIGAISSGIGKVAGVLGKVGNFIGHTKANVHNAQVHFANDLAFATGHSRHTFNGYVKAHATGTASLVGEAGPELAYKPYAKQARILGAKGPQLTKVRPGEKILNARDTRKVMSGGLGHGLVLNGYASGTASLGRSARSVSKNYKQITSDSTRQLNKLSRTNKRSWSGISSVTSRTTRRMTRTNKSNWSKIGRDASRSVTNLQRKNRSTWSKITSETNKQTDRTRRNTIGDYSTMRSKVNKQMDYLQSGVIKSANGTSKGFGKAMGKMSGYSKDAMSDTIGQLNKGIRSIDKVLGQFGGNGSVIKPVHFATGTGQLQHNTLAMVNDAPTGPKREAVVKGNGDIYIPHRDNQVMMLEKNDAVLNGYQTQDLAHKMGLTHFAKGSGVSHSQLRKIASKSLANPSQAFAQQFIKPIQATGAELQKGAVDLGKNASTHYGNPWSTAMWTVINNAIGGADGHGGTREAFLKYAERTFHGVKYLMGAANHTLSDCSGMVMQALHHFGIDIGRTTVAMQHSSGVQYLGKSLSRTIPGDLVIFGHGTGAAGHVGIIKNPRTGTMFNETPPYARVTDIADDKGMGYGYYRVKGLHNQSDSKKKTAKPEKSLISLAKRELGSSAIKWIKDHLGDDFGSLGSFSIGGDLRDRARALAGGLKKLDPRATKNGIAAVLGNWNFESGLNPGAINSGGGASGLGQWLGGRLSNLKAFARKHGTSWKNAGTQLSFAVKDEGSDSSILRSVLEGHGSVASLANKFSSEWERGGYNAQHVHGAMEVRKALGFAKGGNHYGATPFIAGEHGPELITANGPVHVDTHEQTKKKVRDLNKEIQPVRVNARATRSHQPITVNINFNGNIGGTRQDAQRIGNIAKEKVVEALEQLFGDEFGTDPSVY